MDYNERYIELNNNFEQGSFAQIVTFPPHYQSVCNNFYFSSFSRISYLIYARCFLLI